jgi:addiction module HigA family antidote
MPMHNPPHPGEVLREFLPESVSVTEAAGKLGVSRQALSAILNGRSGISADMAMRLSKSLGTSAESWLGMQMQYDLCQAKRNPPKGVQKLAARVVDIG